MDDLIILFEERLRDIECDSILLPNKMDYQINENVFKMFRGHRLEETIVVTWLLSAQERF